MQHPAGFSDSEKFIIKGEYVYYNSPGNSYLNKFMSSLQLEEKFENDDNYEILCKNSVTTSKNSEKQYKATPVSKMIYEEPNQDLKFKKERKGKVRNLKKRECRSMKKNKIRQNGYDDKMHHISQHIIKPIELVEKEELEIEEYYVLNLYTDYNDYSDYSYEDDSYCDSDEEYERHMECRIEWFRDMAW